MQNPVTRWLKERREARRGPTLDDVQPMHPYEYPAKRMKERLDARRSELDDIEEHTHPMGMPDGPGPMT